MTERKFQELRHRIHLIVMMPVRKREKFAFEVGEPWSGSGEGVAELSEAGAQDHPC